MPRFPLGTRSGGLCLPRAIAAWRTARLRRPRFAVRSDGRPAERFPWSARTGRFSLPRFPFGVWSARLAVKPGAGFAKRFALPRAIALRRTRRLRRPRTRLARRAELLTIAAQVRLVRPGALRSVLLLEPIPRILVRAPRPPVPPALLLRSRHRLRRPFGLRRVPHLASRKPFHHDVRALPLQLMQRRQQVFAAGRPERGRLVVDQDRPVDEARRHFDYCTCYSVAP